MLASLTPDTGSQTSDWASLCLAVMERAPLPMAMVEGERHLLRCVNPALCRLLGQTQEQLVGKPFSELLADQSRCVSLLDSVFRTGRPQTHAELQCSGPPPVFWSYTMWPVMAEDQPVGIMIQMTEIKQLQEKTLAMNEALLLGSVRQHEHTEAAEQLNARLVAEIAERKQVEDELRASEERLRTLFEAAPMAVFVCDSHAVIQHYNGRAAELWGRKPVCGVEQHCGSVKLWLPGGTVLPHAQSPMMEVLRTGVPVFNVEVFIERPDGSRLPVLVNFAALKNARHEITGVITSFVDITERKRIEQELVAARDEIRQHAQGLEETVAERTRQLRGTISELEGFSYSVSHDMRAPLRAMQGYSQILLDEYGGQLDARGANYLQQIMRSSLRLDRLIQDVLSYSKILHSPLPMASVDLDRLVRDIIETYPNEQPIKSQIQIIGQLPGVIGNEALLTQCISNLLSNGARFVAPGTRPHIKISAEAVEGSQVRVWFKDNGIGIAPENRDCIFRLFERIHPISEYEGTGIGLTIVRKAIDRMGAQVGFQSELGKGSDFWIQLKKG